MENSGHLISSDSEMVEGRLKRTRKTESLPSDDEEAKPAKNLKFEPMHVSKHITFPSPIEAPSPSTHGNQLPQEQEYDSEEPSCKPTTTNMPITGLTSRP
ncbi:hypothetical protein FCOIX_1116 [Fusarium coicis]|nr:hypothetical protein FCOIX_1116 [Fusarium coicis]